MKNGVKNTNVQLIETTQKDSVNGIIAKVVKRMKIHYPRKNVEKQKLKEYTADMLFIQLQQLIPVKEETAEV